MIYVITNQQLFFLGEKIAKLSLGESISKIKANKIKAVISSDKSLSSGKELILGVSAGHDYYVYDISSFGYRIPSDLKKIAFEKSHSCICDEFDLNKLSTIIETLDSFENGN